MRTSFSSQERYQIATVEVSEIEINANGGAAAPVLMLPVRLDFHIHPENPRIGMRFVALQGRMDVAHRPFAVAPAVNVNVMLRSDFKALSDQLHYLIFPLDAGRIAFLERVRNGGELKFVLHLSLTVEKRVALHEPPVPQDAVWGFVYGHEVHVQQELTIPASAWTARVCRRSAMARFR